LPHARRGQREGRRAQRVDDIEAGGARARQRRLGRDPHDPAAAAAILEKGAHRVSESRAGQIEAKDRRELAHRLDDDRGSHRPAFGEAREADDVGPHRYGVLAAGAGALQMDAGGGWQREHGVTRS
jgi:hypothetical protein